MVASSPPEKPLLSGKEGGKSENRYGRNNNVFEFLVRRKDFPPPAPSNGRARERKGGVYRAECARRKRLIAQKRK